MMKREDASITVFLTLILLILMSLICGMVEITRGKVCHNQASRILQIGIDSLMAEYNRPMYDEYHLFFLEDVGKSYEDTMRFYIEKNLEKRAGLFPLTDMYDGSVSNILVTNKSYVTENGGEELLQQICEYMKRETVSEILEKVKSKKETLDKIDTKADEIERKAAEEKEQAKDSRQQTIWMEKIDGISVGNVLKPKKIFAKMFCPGEKKAQTLHITEPHIWEKIKDKVISIETMLKQIEKNEKKRKEYKNIFHEAAALFLQIKNEAENHPQTFENVTGGNCLREEIKQDLTILRESEQLLSASWEEENNQKMHLLWDNYKMPSICYSYEGMGEHGGAQNPLDYFSSALSGGILKMVFENEDIISKEKVENPDHHLKLFQEEEKEKRREPVKMLTEDEEVDFKGNIGKIGGMALTEAYLIGYIKKFFSNEIQKEGADNVLKYEWEYLIGGKATDKENLSVILDKIVLLRTAANASALFSSAKSRETAYAAAIAVVGFTAMEPLIRFFQTLFIVLWGMAESIVDVAALLQNKQVSLLKSAEQFYVSFADLMRFSHDYVMKKVHQYPSSQKTSFGYEEYLSIFLLSMDKSTICCRMMDLMEWKIQKKYVPQFRLGICTTKFQVQADFLYPWKLPFGFHKQREFEVELELEAAY